MKDFPDILIITSLLAIVVFPVLLLFRTKDGYKKSVLITLIAVLMTDVCGFAIYGLYRYLVR